jgi:hypothetical protein
MPSKALRRRAAATPLVVAKPAWVFGGELPGGGVEAGTALALEGRSCS